MKRVLIGIALFIVGAIGLFLSACGAMFASYSAQHGGRANGEYGLAWTVTITGLLMLCGVIAFIVRTVRKSRARPVVSGTIRSTDDLPS
jgi:hypothetical protein